MTPDRYGFHVRVQTIRPSFEPVPQPGPVRWFHAGRWTMIESPDSAELPVGPQVFGKTQPRTQAQLSRAGKKGGRAFRVLAAMRRSGVNA